MPPTTPAIPTICHQCSVSSSNAADSADDTTGNIDVVTATEPSEPRWVPRTNAIIPAPPSTPDSTVTPSSGRAGTLGSDRACSDGKHHDECCDALREWRPNPRIVARLADERRRNAPEDRRHQSDSDPSTVLVGQTGGVHDDEQREQGDDDPGRDRGRQRRAESEIPAERNQRGAQHHQRAGNRCRRRGHRLVQRRECEPDEEPRRDTEHEVTRGKLTRDDGEAHRSDCHASDERATDDRDGVCAACAVAPKKVRATNRVRLRSAPSRIAIDQSITGSASRRSGRPQ